MQGSHAWRADGAVFDDDNIVSHAGLVPLLALAEQTNLSDLLDEHVRFACERVKKILAPSSVCRDVTTSRGVKLAHRRSSLC